MIETDLLARYSDLAVIHRAMDLVLSRLGLRHLGPQLAVVLDDSLAALAEDFDAYYPQLDAFARAERPMAVNWAQSTT